MLRLKVNYAPFSPPFLYSFSLRGPSPDEAALIKEKGFLVSERDGILSFSILKEEIISCDHPLFREMIEISNFVEMDSWRVPLRGGRYLERNGRPLIMGILNVTPDSFYDGGRYTSVESAVERALEMVEEGVDIIDVGGESTRPGSEGVDEEEEAERVIPVIEGIRKHSRIPISVDTTKGSVARKALEAGADIVNDISGFRFDGSMVDVCVEREVPAVIMHTTGRPREMQKRIRYRDLVWDILDYLKGSVDAFVEKGGKPDFLIVDPGIGFGKTPEHNLTIINRAVEFKSLGRPVLLGPSRKSFIGRFLGLENPADRLEGSLSVFSIATLKGVDILRVHDVREAKMVVDMAYHVATEGTCSRP